jgi:protein-S-isoprenylcysteine O-methyltransferase
VPPAAFSPTLVVVDPAPTRRNTRRTRGDTGWFLAGCGGLVGFLLVEASTRRPGDASRWDAGSADQGTTRAIVTAYGLGVELPLLLRRLPVPQLPPPAAPLGVLAEMGGLGLRGWSMRTLGHSYTRTLRTADEQVLVDTGPYRWVRHPGYTGSLLTWIGFAVASRSVPAVIAVAALLGRAYLRRIAAEEEMLRRELRGYTAYSRRTRKLVPLVW